MLGSSSEPSEQSFSLSQRHDAGIHLPDLHRNSEAVHVRLSEKTNNYFRDNIRVHQIMVSVR